MAKKAKKKLISETERVALEAGDTCFEGGFINGKPRWDELAKVQDDKLTDEEQAFLDGPVEQLCALIDNEEVYNSGGRDLPEEIWDFLKEHKFLGMVIPKEHGGLGFSALAHSAVVTKIASKSFPATINVMVPNSLGPGELITHYGTDEQKEKYLPNLANGSEIPCFGLTEPEAGSDATTLKTKGIVKQDENGERYIHIANLDKRYITLAPVATLLGVAFDLQDPDGLLEDGKEGITLSLVPHDTEGLEIGSLSPMDVPFPNGTIKGDIKIPLDSIIGGEKKAGHGWQMLMEALSIGRSISLPAMSVSANKYTSYVTGAYTTVREQFKSAVGNFEGVQEKLAEMAGTTYLTNATRVVTARLVDQQKKPTLPSAIAKYHLTESMRTNVNNAMDIMSGKAVISGPNNPVNKLYQGVPIAITVEGANIMTRNLMIFGQGGVKTHDHVFPILDSLENKQKMKFLRHAIPLVLKTIPALAGAWAPDVLHGGNVPDADAKNKKFYNKINRLSKAFNAVSNVSYVAYQDKLKIKERLSARLGDVMSNLYMASCALQKFENDGRPEGDRPLVEWATRHALGKAEEALDKTLTNYPSKGLAFMMRSAVFPWFRTGIDKALNKSIAPDDELDHRVARILLTQNETRERLTDGIYKSGGIAKDMNDAMEKMLAAAPIQRAARKEKRDFTPEEQLIIDEAREAQLKIIAVDELPKPQTKAELQDNDPDTRSTLPSGVPGREIL